MSFEYSPSTDEYDVFVDRPNSDTSDGWSYELAAGLPERKAIQDASDNEPKFGPSPENSLYRPPVDPGNPGPRPNPLAEFAGQQTTSGHAATIGHNFTPRSD